MSSKSTVTQNLCLNVRSTAAGYIRSHFVFNHPGMEWSSTPGGSLLIGVKPNDAQEMEMYVIAVVVHKYANPELWEASVFAEPVKLDPVTTTYATTTYDILEKTPRLLTEQKEIREQRDMNSDVGARRAVLRFMLPAETLLTFAAKGNHSEHLKRAQEHAAVVSIPESTWDLL
jgi:hypothetical protein